MAPKEFASLNDKSGYPSALTIFENDYESGFQPRSVVELKIMEMEGSIREKGEWWNKVNDARIVTKWRQELMEHLERDNENADDPLSLDYRARMVDYAIDECKWQAEVYSKGPVRPSAADGVFVRDDLDQDLRAKMLQSVAELRAMPAIGAKKEDRHPGTPQMVDLVHPSLYAYERGKTMVLPDVGAEATKMPEWSGFLGKEGIFEKPLDPKNSVGYDGAYSPTGLQWLPSEFQVSRDGKTCEISSYINSLHPVRNAELYKTVADLFCHAVPLLEEVLAEAGEHKGLHNGAVRDRALRIPIDQEWWGGEPRDQGPDEDDETYEAYLEEWHTSPGMKTFTHPEIPQFESPPEFTCGRGEVTLREIPLQVIVKIASLELEPTESYEGGVWHVEGTLGERIVATACCYLECDNVCGGELAFRTSVAEPEYEQDDREGVRRMYNLRDEEKLLQQAGSCVTREGRMLAWPNTKQHKVSPVHLVDAKKPGKRTICCFFLVDPKLRIRSTATVPPQQLAWVADGAVSPALSAAGMNDDALRHVMDQLASTTLLTYEAACERRERLMNERRKPDENVEDAITRTFSLCEH